MSLCGSGGGVGASGITFERWRMQLCLLPKPFSGRPQGSGCLAGWLAAKGCPHPAPDPVCTVCSTYGIQTGGSKL